MGLRARAAAHPGPAAGVMVETKGGDHCLVQPQPRGAPRKHSPLPWGGSPVCPQTPPSACGEFSVEQGPEGGVQ